jgi:hypothetical protein
MSKLSVLAVAVLAVPLCSRAEAGPVPVAILISEHAAAQELLAAREVQRFWFLRTGALAAIRTAPAVDGPEDLVVIASRGESLADAVLSGGTRDLGPQQFRLKTLRKSGRTRVAVLGGDARGALYGSYRLIEAFGVRFYLHGDIVPDELMKPELPSVDELGRPLFETRGIQPFHDFPEGPDWWNAEDYRAILAQATKLRMNFFGLHTYPDDGPHAEPTVWIGLPGDVDPQGRVSSSYASSYNNTERTGGIKGVAHNWGYRARRTSEYLFGASELFEREAFGGDVMTGLMPLPATADDSNLLFDRAGELLRGAFAWARALGMANCVGTETPLVVPKAVQENLRRQGKDPADPAVVQELYEGVFTRAARTYAPDYYWFWTPEGWTWEGEKDEDVRATLADLESAVAALKKVGAPIGLATCGWVLGPSRDRALFDRALPKDVAFSCINRKVGKAFVDPAFGRIAGRPKWAIPWLEDDPALTAPQLWVARTRRDAADARRYGCTGLLGIHWRTRNVAPTAAMLAQAGWRSEWEREPAAALGAIGGFASEIPDREKVAGTDDEPLYQWIRTGPEAYRFSMPNGAYALTLHFVEPYYSEAGRRVFDVAVEGRTAVASLDIAARAGGKNRALTVEVPAVVVKDGVLEVRFVPRVEVPVVAAISVRGPGFERKVNCGGLAYRDYAADDPAPVGEFYRDWAWAEFGPEVSRDAAAIFVRLDGRLPTTADWTDGPGGYKPDPRPWSEVARDFAFVDELAALESRVRGSGARERFAWWLGQFQYMRATGRLRCVLGDYERALAEARSAPSPEAQARQARERVLPARAALIPVLEEIHRHLLATVSTTGELGTVANWASHILPGLPLSDPRLERLLGEALPDPPGLSRTYRGPARIFVPAAPTSAPAGEALRIRAVVLSETAPRDVRLHWRPMGRGDFQSVPLTRLARGVYSGHLPPLEDGQAWEYHIAALDGSGQPVRFPPTAPDLNQTVVTVPAAAR